MDERSAWFTPHLLDRVADGIVFTDRELRYVYVNEAAVALLRKPSEELIGRYVWDVFPQPPDSPFRGPLDEAHRTGRPGHVEGLNVRREAWYDCYFYPSEGGMLTIFRDVTEKKRVEAALVESEARFRMMAEAAPVMIWMADLSRARTYFNRRWLEFTGRTLQEEVGFGWAEGIHPDDRDRCLQVYASAFERRETFWLEYRLRYRDGSYRWIFLSGAPLWEEEGRLAGYIGGCLDVHDRKLAEERLAFLAAASEVLSSSLDYATTLAHVSELLVPRLADWFAVELLAESGAVERVATGHVNPEKVRWARAMRERFPVDLDASHGSGRVIRTGEPEFAPVITEEMLVASARDEEYLRFVRETGLRSVICVPLRARERTIGALTMVWSETGNRYTEEDVVFAQELARRAAAAIENARLYWQTRTAEEELRTLNETLESRVEERTAALAERNADLQSFASAASHDLQEPLRKVRMFIDLLRQELGKPGPPISHYVERIDSSAARMSQFIVDLLALSRVATRGETFRRTDLGPVVEEVVADLEVEVEAAGGRIEVGDLPAVEADPVQMRQLFQNLIGNALKFRRQEVPPLIHIGVEGLSQEAKGGPAGARRCCLVVADNGIGFEEKYLDRMFQPFQRLHGRSVYPGSGMGLAICRRIVERHGGTITARSTLGAGSTFVFTLPLTHAENGEAALMGLPLPDAS